MILILASERSPRRAPTEFALVVFLVLPVRQMDSRLRLGRQTRRSDFFWRNPELAVFDKTILRGVSL
jgi:hypothetical protein